MEHFFSLFNLGVQRNRLCHAFYCSFVWACKLSPQVQMLLDGREVGPLLWFAALALSYLHNSKHITENRFSTTHNIKYPNCHITTNVHTPFSNKHSYGRVWAKRTITSICLNPFPWERLFSLEETFGHFIG